MANILHLRRYTCGRRRLQVAAKTMRKGFMNLTKARQSLGRGTVSAHDVREDMWASLTLG